MIYTARAGNEMIPLWSFVAFRVGVGLGGTQVAALRFLLGWEAVGFVIAASTSSFSFS